MNPITENLAYLNMVQIKRHIDMLFGNHEFQRHEYVCIRGIGEKGTAQEGKFREDIFMEPNTEFLPFEDQIGDHCERWAQYNVASFIVPAILNQDKASATNVMSMSTIVVDLDSSPVQERLDHLIKYIGEPEMVVNSGGTTHEGEQKKHVWYTLTQQETDIPRVIRLRHEIARKVGGDLSLGLGVESNLFGRCHQPIRIAGSVHAKQGLASSCSIVSAGCGEYDIDNLERLIKEMPDSAHAHPEPQTTPTLPAPLESQGMFGESTGLRGMSSDTDRPPALQRDVAEGGTNETRWGVFNEVAGTNIHSARRGDITLEEAKRITHGWMVQHMHPAWPEGRFDSEWQGMVNHDAQANGRILPPKPPEVLPFTNEGGGIFEWTADKWITDPKPNHTYLVDRLVIRGEPHSFIAEGGSGKTFMAADLALKVAATGLVEEEFEWCGQKVLQGGTVVLILCEDSKTEMHRRLLDLDNTGLIQRAGKRLIVLPMPALGGAFTVAQFNKKTGEVEPTTKWEMMMRELARIKDLALVCIDTFASINMGDENSAVAVQNSLNMVARVTGLGAALMITHHIRKQGSEPVRNCDDMLNSIRGSSAFPSFFRINMGMWHAADFSRRMKGLGLPPRPRSMYRFAILKCNINGLMQSEKTLLRDETGLLVDVTARDVFSSVNVPERLAWLVFAVREAARELHPYTGGGKNAANGFYRRRTELPPILREVGSGEFSKLIEAAMHKELLVYCSVKGSKSKTYLDDPEGPLASNQEGAELDGGAYSPPNWENYGFDPELGEITGRIAKVNWEREFSPSQPQSLDGIHQGSQQEPYQFQKTGIPVRRVAEEPVPRMGATKAERAAERDQEEEDWDPPV